MRHTLGSFKRTANWAQIINVDASDPQFLLWLNQLLERLLLLDLYVGSTQRYQICNNSGCITWPRQFETIEAMDVCDRPMTLRNHWFEFLENGPGRAKVGGTGCQTLNAYDRGLGFVMFDDVTVPSRIRLYTQFASDAGKTVTLRGFDRNGQEVLTNNGATAGEVLTLTNSFVDSQTVWMPQVFREVIKDATNGYVRAYSYDATLPVPPLSPGPNDTPLKPLAAWEPSETLPNYRRTTIPALPGMQGGCGCNGGFVATPASTVCARPASVTVRAKIAFIPVASDLDFLWTGNAPALKLGMLALMREERGDMAGAQAAMNGTFNPVTKRFENGCIPLMDAELDSFQGVGTVAPLRLESVFVDRASVQNFI